MAGRDSGDNQSELLCTRVHAHNKLVVQGSHMPVERREKVNILWVACPWQAPGAVVSDSLQGGEGLYGKRTRDFAPDFVSLYFKGERSLAPDSEKQTNVQFSNSAIFFANKSVSGRKKGVGNENWQRKRFFLVYPRFRRRGSLQRYLLFH